MSGQTNWFGLTRASKVGDSVTIILRESASASRSQNTDITRSSAITASGGIGNLFNPAEISTNLESGLSSNNLGGAGQSANLKGSITATVMEVFPNGSMVIQGEKNLTMTQGSERLRVRGIVRPDDISPRNTVYSYRLAGAEFSYEGRGDLAQAGRPGWGVRALNSLWPF